MSNMTAVILGGGQSKRLGRDKAGVMVGGKTVLGRVVDTLRTVTDDIVLVESVGQQREWLSAEQGLRLALDEFPGRGPLAGLHAGLLAARSPYAWVVACDMPFLSTGLLAYMAKISPGWQAVVPVWEGKPQPLCAVYATECYSVASQFLASWEAGLKHLLDAIEVCWVGQDSLRSLGVEAKVFAGINTEPDLTSARALAD